MDANQQALFTVEVRYCAFQLAQVGTAALGRLYDLTAPRLVRYAAMLTRNQDDAEDAVQAAMVRIALKPEVLSGAWHPWPYFLKVVRNEALRILRQRRFQQLSLLTADKPARAESTCEGAESQQFVQAALRMLPTSQAEVVVLKIWEEMTFAEIGEVLGQSPNTIASRYRYALRKLSEHLQPLSDEVKHD